jgi:hypothetical protein
LDLFAEGFFFTTFLPPVSAIFLFLPPAVFIFGALFPVLGDFAEAFGDLAELGDLADFGDFAELWSLKFVAKSM